MGEYTFDRSVTQKQKTKREIFGKSLSTRPGSGHFDHIPLVQISHMVSFGENRT